MHLQFWRNLLSYFLHSRSAKSSNNKNGWKKQKHRFWQPKGLFYSWDLWYSVEISPSHSPNDVYNEVVLGKPFFPLFYINIVMAPINKSFVSNNPSEFFEKTIYFWALLAIRFLLLDLRLLHLIQKTKCLKDIIFCQEKLKLMQNLFILKHLEIFLIFLHLILWPRFFYYNRVNLIRRHRITRLVSLSSLLAF